jgi:type III pantothenate kinase
MGYNLVIDVGNSNIVCALFHQNRMAAQWRIITDPARDAAWFAHEIGRQCSAAGCALSQLDAIAFASVVPVLAPVLATFASQYTSATWMEVSWASDLGLIFPVDDPSYIGADLVVNAWAAREKYQTSCIICDLGTATTIQLVGADGFFYGTSILPGVMTATNSLIEKAAKIQAFDLTAPPSLLALNTADALRSGIVHGHRMIIDGFVQEIRALHPDTPITAIATGGLAQLICADSRQIDVIDPLLTIEGLQRICTKKL